jgi:protein-tyrosine kinase
MQNTIQKENTSLSSSQINVGNIGKLLLQLGKIRPEDTNTILRVQQEHNLRFGDAALKLGLITEADISQALALQFNYPYLQPGQGSYSMSWLRHTSHLVNKLKPCVHCVAS